MRTSDSEFTFIFIFSFSDLHLAHPLIARKLFGALKIANYQHEPFGRHFIVIVTIALRYHILISKHLYVSELLACASARFK